jgi:hypothetical protein
MSAVIVVSNGFARLFYTGRRDIEGQSILVGSDDPRVLRYVNGACAANDWRRVRAAFPRGLVVTIEETP